MLSKPELIPARDRLKEADRHLAYVKGSLKQIKSIEDKRIVNDLVGAIESQCKALEQMLQVLDTVVRSDQGVLREQAPERPGLYLHMMRERRRLRSRAPYSAQGCLDVNGEESLETVAQAAG